MLGGRYRLSRDNPKQFGIHETQGAAREMTPQEKLKQLDERLDEVHKLIVYLNECRRELINRHNLNKEKL